MFEIQPITTEQGLLLIGVAIALAAISWKFNEHIDAQAETDPLASNSATYTVIGVAYTLTGALAVFAILFDWALALFAVGVVLVAFGVSGTPMIFGDMRRGSRRRREELRKLKAQQMVAEE